MNDIQYILGVTQEECAEVIQAISKVNRFGIDSISDKDPKAGTKRDCLISELGDVLGMIELTIKSLKLSRNGVQKAKQAKIKKVVKHLKTK